MAKLVVDEASLVSVADAIRTKGGTSENLEFPEGFVDAVGAIEVDGGTEEIEALIDQSGVLDSTDGTATVTKKVEQLIDLVEENILPDWDDDSPIVASGQGYTQKSRWELTEKGTLRWVFVDTPTTSNDKIASIGTTLFTALPESYKNINYQIKQIYFSDGFAQCYAVFAPYCERIRFPDSTSGLSLQGLPSLKELDLRNTTAQIRENFSSQAHSIENVFLSNNATDKTLPANALKGCYKITNIDLSSIINFNMSCCMDTYNLSQEITFNPNLALIYTNAFAQSGITKVYFQNSLDSLPNIYNSAFSNCKALTDIYCPWAEGAVANAPWGAPNATIHYNTTYDENGNPVVSEV